MINCFPIVYNCWNLSVRKNYRMTTEQIKTDLRWDTVRNKKVEKESNHEPCDFFLSIIHSLQRLNVLNSDCSFVNKESNLPPTKPPSFPLICESRERFINFLKSSDFLWRAKIYTHIYICFKTDKGVMNIRNLSYFPFLCLWTFQGCCWFLNHHSQQHWIFSTSHYTRTGVSGKGTENISNPPSGSGLLILQPFQVKIRQSWTK